jgi:hypothetical protein
MSVERIDFSNRKVDLRTSILSKLEPEQSYIHDHTSMKTPFPVWIATRRNRMNKEFKYSTTDDDGSQLPVGWYRIFL